MKAVLDACVLFPTVLREILIGAAERGLYDPVWSPRILEEWRRAAARLGPDQQAVAGAEIALLEAAWPHASAADDGTRAAGFDWPDPADRHVAETALAAGAGVIVTANLRDFPRRVAGALALEVIHPDAFLLRLFDASPDAVAASVAASHARAQDAGGAIALPALLPRARLPRLAKALARCGLAAGR